MNWYWIVLISYVGWLNGILIYFAYRSSVGESMSQAKTRNLGYLYYWIMEYVYFITCLIFIPFWIMYRQLKKLFNNF